MPAPVQDPQFTRLKEYLDQEWGPPAVQVMVRTLFANGLPPIPKPERWSIDSRLDICELIWKQTQSEKFVEEMWPSIKMLLGEDTCNTMWSAQVLTFLALFNIIRILPIAYGD